MVQKDQAPIQIDLNHFKLHINLPERLEVSIHFNSPSRKFYLSIVALVVHGMKKYGEIVSIPLEEHHHVLELLNETIGGKAGISDSEHLLPRIYRKWKDALPDLEHAPLFRVLGRKKGYEDAIGKIYSFTDEEKDLWANLFDYKGSQEHVRLRFSVDRLGASLEDVTIVYGTVTDRLDEEAWDEFLRDLREVGEKGDLLLDTQEDKEEPIARAANSNQGPLKIRKKWKVLVCLIGLAMTGVLVLSWYLYFHGKPSEPESKFSGESLRPSPEKPSIAVLPFTNLSGDPEQEYFVDGITEQIITALSSMSRLFVIARNSTFTYKGKPVMVQQVADELGVKYVLEGSVHRLKGRVRITAQLVDAITGRHIWSGRYDSSLSNIFKLQDDITLKIIKAIGVKLTEGEQTRLLALGTSNLDAYLKVLESLEYFRKFTPESLILCRMKAKEAIVLDPEYPTAWAMVAWSHFVEVNLGFSKTPQESLAEGARITQKGLTLDQKGFMGHYLMSYYCLFQREYDKALEEIRQAQILNPNGADVTAFYGLVLCVAGKPEESIPKFEKAIRLNPIPPAWYWHNFGHAYRQTAQYDAAIRVYKKAIVINPNHFSAWTGITATYVLAGKKKEAQEAAKEILRIHPEFSVKKLEKSLNLKDKTEISTYIGALREAGLK
jgi:TolB-like protein/Tfp pilus assembly protein PilF